MRFIFTVGILLTPVFAANASTGIPSKAPDVVMCTFQVINTQPAKVLYQIPVRFHAGSLETVPGSFDAIRTQKTMIGKTPITFRVEAISALHTEAGTTPPSISVYIFTTNQLTDNSVINATNLDQFKIGEATIGTKLAASQSPQLSVPVPGIENTFASVSCVTQKP